MSFELSQGLSLLPASPLPGFPDVLVGTQEDGADVLLGNNTLQVAAVVNCALEDWLYKVRNGSCGAAAASRLPEIEASVRVLPHAGGVALGDISGIRYCALPARDRDRAEPIIIDGEVAVPGLEPYDMGQHLPAAVAFLRDQVAAGRKVLIHCLRGENRAGAVAAAFLAAEGALPEEAVQKVRFKALLDFCERLRSEPVSVNSSGVYFVRSSQGRSLELCQVREARGTFALSNRAFVEQARLRLQHPSASVPSPHQELP
ncbi:unnamed protein product [Symbiodinium natans]|uniref:Tyrosine specific protein phosphatases domain-containing protein n=1 Tax=Symbiodinium natans TaxID=878477 RepID=A0A812RNF3_9DINO|nr:unnamed protein product [Symbiodinium natans]